MEQTVYDECDLLNKDGRTAVVTALITLTGQNSTKGFQHLLVQLLHQKVRIIDDRINGLSDLLENTNDSGRAELIDAITEYRNDRHIFLSALEILIGWDDATAYPSMEYVGDLIQQWW